MKENDYIVEVLAPAGSYDIFKAVIAAGADAVYLGGDMFGARAFAGNFGKDELISAIDYAHIRGKKVYMTVNTLLKENEINNVLTDYIAPFYEAGLDAAIVQDMGVFKVLKENFPEFALHASTQMTVTGSFGTSILEKIGASRVVTARELNFDEIRSIRENCNIEIESFVHGALCYCYSGQCLLSSMNGQRSGNRGRCAQPCRLPYDVYSVASSDANCSSSVCEGKNKTYTADGRTIKINDSNSLYALSPKDMCALDILPQVIRAGVNSLKIEGRMKNATYAAGVTAIYRKYVDMFLENGDAGYKVDRQDIIDLMDIYNRGEFTSGYYNNSKGRDMMSVQRPNHMGVKALEVIENVAGKVTFKTLININRQDVFEIDGSNSFSSGGDYARGSKMIVNLPRKYNLTKGRILYRTRNNAVTVRIIENYVDRQLKTKVNMYLYGECGALLCLVLEALGTTVTVYGDIVEAASKQPADRQQTAEHLAALGNTDFVAEDVQVEYKGDVFIPVSRLKSLKRKGIEELTKAILEKSRRSVKTESIGAENESDVSRGDFLSAAYKENGIVPALKPDVVVTEFKQDVIVPELKPDVVLPEFKENILVTDLKQFEAADNNPKYKEIYVDFTVAESVSEFKGTSKKYLVLPHVLRGKNHDKCRKLIEKAVSSEILSFDGFLVRNLEELGLISQIAAESGYSGTRNIILDAGLYCWNTWALYQYKNMIENIGLRLKRITMPYELKAGEMPAVLKAAADIGIETELIVSSRIPLMVSEQCVRKTYGLCNKNNSVIRLDNMKNGHYTVKSICDYCYSIMYSGQYDIRSMKPKVAELNTDFVRYELVYEDVEKADCNRIEQAFTGHFDRGVD